MTPSQEKDLADKIARLVKRERARFAIKIGDRYEDPRTGKIHTITEINHNVQDGNVTGVRGTRTSGWKGGPPEKFGADNFMLEEMIKLPPLKKRAKRASSRDASQRADAKNARRIFDSLTLAELRAYKRNPFALGDIFDREKFPREVRLEFDKLIARSSL